MLYPTPCQPIVELSVSLDDVPSVWKKHYFPVVIVYMAFYTSFTILAEHQIQLSYMGFSGDMDWNNQSI